MTIFYREWHLLDDETSALVRSSRRRYEDLWAKTIRDGIEAGVFRSDVEPRSVVYALIGMCVWTNQRMREATEDEVERLASDNTKVALGGLAT
jgi:hypothetical protein